MRELNTLSFTAVETAFYDGYTATTVAPDIDGVSLLVRIAEFERERGIQPAGGYLGLLFGAGDYGDLVVYFLGADVVWREPGMTLLLGCECGDGGCRPLAAHITAWPHVVMWTDFGQRVRGEYADFGPFVFDRVQYEQAVESMRRDLGMEP